jgi:hypothetical protein
VRRLQLGQLFARHLRHPRPARRRHRRRPPTGAQRIKGRRRVRTDDANAQLPRARPTTDTEEIGCAWQMV